MFSLQASLVIHQDSPTVVIPRWWRHNAMIDAYAGHSGKPRAYRCLYAILRVVCCSMLIIERKRMLESENETNTTIQNYRRGFWRELSAIDGCWKWKFCKMRKLKAYSTRYSQAVTHPSTNRARRCLTSVIGREPVRSTWYGRRHYRRFMSQHL